VLLVAEGAEKRSAVVLVVDQQHAEGALRVRVRRYREAKRPKPGNLGGRSGLEQRLAARPGGPHHRSRVVGPDTEGTASVGIQGIGPGTFGGGVGPGFTGVGSLGPSFQSFIRSPTSPHPRWTPLGAHLPPRC
jgi:hypothetical protein